MRYFPLFADLAEAEVLVAGGGEAAAQKVRLLRKTTARITVMAESLNDELHALARTGAVRHLPRLPRPADLAGQSLVYVATGDRQLEAELFGAARDRGIPINVVDTPELSTFLTPAMVDRDPIVVAIGTEGAAPVLAREIKSRLESWLPANFGVLAKKAHRLRGRVAARIGEPQARRQLWERLFKGAFRRAVLTGADDEAQRIFVRELKAAATPSVGRVVLIGCGPGDPDLLTLKAVQRLQEADVLVVDRLVNPRILEYARRDARRIFVGKVPGGPATSQAEINRILVAEAAHGQVVARLKGGDPLIFGRAGEELAACAAAHLAVEIVPGITAAHACAARIGLPLTVREHRRQFTLLTASSAEGVPDLDWRALAAPEAAFAIYMGVGNAPLLREKLLAAGARAETRVVIVENGTEPEERAVATTLRDLTDAIDQRAITGPAIIFVGLDWAAAGLARPQTIEVHRRRPGRQPLANSDAIAISAEAIL
jgi:uroporphyrin-III C-methyltransferase / precorrin-2 dehydrogenase / sirohydrochlorin ferrochelatase